MYIEFKTGKKYASKNADKSDTHKHFKDAGYILTNDDLIIDIDCLDKQTIEKLISYWNIKTQYTWTERGIHLYFKKPPNFKGAKCICSLGFEIEYKHISNTRAITVKRNWKIRKTVNYGVRESLPEIFTYTRKFSTLQGLSNGDGRNNALFSHRGKLVGYSYETRILNFINLHIFSEPLSEEEFKSITRNIVMIEGKNVEYNTASELIKSFNINVHRDELYFYDGVKFINNDLRLKKAIFQSVGEQKTLFVDEVFKQMLYRGKIVDNEEVFKIKLANGVLSNGEFYEIDYKEFTPYYIDIEYKENTKRVAIVDKYINQLCNGDQDYINLVFEILAHTLITDHEFKRMLAKFFIFVGDGGNGKGTLLNIIRKILDNKNCTGLSIKNLSDERYVCNLENKLVNLGDDIHDQPINDKDMKALKNISTCDYTELRKLFKNSKSATITASLIFTSNHILKSWEKGESYKRRVMWLPMYGKPKRKDPKFITKLTTQESLQYWIKLIIDGYKRLYENGGFTKCEIVNEFNKKYHEDNNGSEVYIRDLSEEDIVGKTSSEVFAEFEIWCEENDYNASKKMMNDAIYKIHKLKTKLSRANQKVKRVYQKVEENLYM